MNKNDVEFTERCGEEVKAGEFAVYDERIHVCGGNVLVHSREENSGFHFLDVTVSNENFIYRQFNFCF